MTDPRVPPYLGRILGEAGDPAGTCFQVAPGVLVTAWHVLGAVGADSEGSVVQVDPLRGGPARPAEVVRLDPLHDLAVLRAGDSWLVTSASDQRSGGSASSSSDPTRTRRSPSLPGRP